MRVKRLRHILVAPGSNPGHNIALHCGKDQKEASGQSYKHFTLLNYDSRVVIGGIFQSGTTLES